MLGPDSSRSSAIRSWAQTILLCAALLGSTFLLARSVQYYFRRTPGLGELDLRKVMRIVDENSVEELTEEQKIKAVLDGLASALGPHARAFDPQELKTRMEELHNYFVGVGIRFKRIKGEYTVVLPLPSSGAEKAGIKSGDVILEADGKVLNGQDFDVVKDMLRGPVNSSVTVKVRRPGTEEPFDVAIVRSPVSTSSVAYTSILGDGQTGFIRIEDFASETPAHLRNAVGDLLKAGATRLVIDLRHNPGGLLTSGTGCADIFIQDGTIVTMRAGRGEHKKDTVFSATAENTVTDLPLAVLIDGRSASAAEIFAAAMKDHDRAVIVGSKSYGKGTVQSTYEDGLAGFALKFTTALFYSPKGTKIQDNGIVPDLEVKQTEEEFNISLLIYDIAETRRHLPGYYPEVLDALEITEESLSDPVADAAAKLLAGEPQPVPDAGGVE